MTRQTSIDCYNEIKVNGLLSKRKMEVYDCLFKHGPMTMGEVYSKLSESSEVNQASVTPRFAELRNVGAIYEKNTRSCTITGKMGIEWDLTDNLPQKIQKPTTKKHRINDAINALRELYKNKNTATDADWKSIADLIKII